MPLNKIPSQGVNESAPTVEKTEGSGEEARKTPRAILLRSAAGKFIPALAGIIVALAFFCGWTLANFSKPVHAFHYLRGESLVLEPASITLGDGAAGEKRDLLLVFTNLSKNKIVLLGVTTSCGCIAMGDLPATVPPGKILAFPMTFTYNGPVGQRIEQTVVFTTDCSTQVRLGATIYGHTVEEVPPLSNR